MVAAWGFIGYACFAVGNLLELSGVAGAALVAAIPGGLFELTFAIWLIARGFSPTTTAVRPRISRLRGDWPCTRGTAPCRCPASAGQHQLGKYSGLVVCSFTTCPSDRNDPGGSCTAMRFRPSGPKSA